MIRSLYSSINFDIYIYTYKVEIDDGRSEKWRRVGGLSIVLSFTEYLEGFREFGILKAGRVEGKLCEKYVQHALAY